MYIEHHEAFSAWVANHAEETASQITGENKTKFVLSQVLFNTVLISSQVAIGGAFSFLDLGATGVISPMVAKGILIAFPASERTGPLVVPELPASLSEFTPDSDDTVGSSVRFLDASERSYAQMLSDGTFRFQTGAREFAIAGETTRSAQQTFIVASP